jgi:ABC-type branched-subunit amino acid transport system substrate-binding protein
MKRSIEKDSYLSASLDFYSGVLTAIDSLKKLGISLKVDVYDTKRQVSEVSNIINTNNFDTVDAVIGPLTSSCFEEAASKLEIKNIPVVSPIGTKLKLRGNVFQSKSSDALLKDKVLNYVKSSDTLGNVLIVSDTKNISIANELKQEFPQAKQVRSRRNKEGEDEFFVTKGDIESVLKPGKNIVFLETQNDGFASNVTSILASLIRKEDKGINQEAIDIVLMTTNINSAFQGEDIDNTHLSNLQFHYASSSKEYSEKDENSFVKTYSKLYNVTPNKRAVKGFDLTMDVVLRLAAFNDLYSSVNQASLTEYVENKFAYKKKLVGGFYNTSVYLVKYDDLTVVEVKQ